VSALTLGVQPTRPRDDWAWGENRTVDAVVLATTLVGQRHLLLIRRGDCGAWALPGGWVESGESVTVAAARELAEETGLRVPHACGIPQRPRLVPDPRSTAWSWIVTTPVVLDLGVVDKLPEVEGGDDAREADWFLADDFTELVDCVEVRGGLYGAHRPMLRDLLA
jgi:ADP-ribose pyrophosphatase